MRGQRLSQEIEAAIREYERPRYLRVKTTLLVHDDSQTRTRCPCCGSVWAALSEEIEAGDLIIDLVMGDRFTTADVDPATWDDLCDEAKLHELRLRCSRNQLPLLTDTSGRHIFASGAQRSGKTYCGLAWMALQWLRGGGFEKRFWLVASTLPKAFRLLQKLFIGDSDAPPFLPRELTQGLPVTHRASDTRTQMVDGSIFELKYFDGDPGGERLKSDDIVAGLCDEASHLPTYDSFNALEGRTMTHGGHLFFSSTPRPESFLKELIVDPALAFERLALDDPKRTDGTHAGSRWIFRAMPMGENPWNDKDNLAAKMRTLDMSSPSVQRDYFGTWVGSSGPLWTMWIPERHILAHEARTFEALGMDYRSALGTADHKDITSECVSLIFGQMSPHYKGVRASNRRYILGTDVNISPMSSCVIGITAPADDPKNRDRWHFWVWDVIQTSGNSRTHVECLDSTYFGRIMSPGSKASPVAGCGVIIDAKALGRDPTAHRFGGDPTGIAELFGLRGFDTRAPRYISVEKKGRVPMPPSRMDSFLLTQRIISEGRLHVSNRSSALLESFIEQQDSGNGWGPEKNDKLASPIDGLRYALWALVHAPTPATIRG